ncbi:hypothetical protein BOX15_Mlig006970g2 [Macrostomum lignano]|nr:hypothetical protein BOX15_Mlig006970g1 [Macrostomum lignano]PAA78060.1 hypothetical protein BOX15_Mlig006970g3 [Macrostomum lignano]PAA80595.1 hypothetical protein BOX15_Mlig006970g2 [Macrostomum lignano]
MSAVAASAVRLPSLNSQATSRSPPRVTAGFRFPPGGATTGRLMTTVAMTTEDGGSSLDLPVEQALSKIRYRDCGNPGPGSYNLAGPVGFSPAWSMGRRTWAERKIAGAKQSLEKSWFCTCDPWRQKVDGLYREEQWPEPATYRLRSLGQPDPTRPRASGFQFNSRASYDPELRRQLACPPPGAYEATPAGVCDNCQRCCRIGCRGETRLWPAIPPNPGPGRYDNEKSTAMVTKVGRRRFTMKGPKQRMDFARVPLGPFFSF